MKASKGSYSSSPPTATAVLTAAGTGVGMAVGREGGANEVWAVCTNSMSERGEVDAVFVSEM